MSTLTTVLAILVALEHLYIMFLETIATNSKSTSRVFGISIDQLKSKTIATLLKNQGVYNGLIAVLLFVAEGAEAYEAIDTDGLRVGGAIIAIDSAEHRGELSFLYVKVGVQSKGIGQGIWKAIERLHPEVEVWETCTPYFDRRNIHFYINRLGFHAVEFFNEHHPDPHMPEQFDQEDGLFKFEKCV